MPKQEKKMCGAYAFCFSEASGQYKVLRLGYGKFDGRLKATELEVCTLGVDEKWNYVGEVPKPLWRSFSNANVNGFVHWMNSEKNDSIYSFNSLTEEVKSLNNSEYIDIWGMKEYGIAESWTKTRILKDTIQPNIRSDRFIPISTWKDGEILMQQDRGMQVVSYNPKEKKFTKVKVYFGYAATRYIPSFYSVKTVIGESSQVSYTHPKIDIL
ncbi:hypothetical protein MTR67_021453 [Solanum verrucosum]|uniref:F-box associated domain-containing protein n=1 Tax=Solanum verrucosum TaxID=315347 RepID=A0AAF0QTI1_SOLVR|nr:hypothetical protein MTR67_021453 [Solanum verrucosum]